MIVKHFISRLMHSNIQNLEVKIYVVEKFKTQKSLQHVSDPMRSTIREYRAVLDWNYLLWFTDIYRVLGRCLAA
jgi:hypothetical protein